MGEISIKTWENLVVKSAEKDLKKIWALPFHVSSGTKVSITSEKQISEPTQKYS